MQRVKLFKGLECEVDRLEQQINEWAESEGVKNLPVSYTHLTLPTTPYV